MWANIMVVMTSWAPVRTFRKAGMIVQRAPKSPAKTNTRGMLNTPGSASLMPSHVAAMAPR